MMKNTFLIINCFLLFIYSCGYKSAKTYYEEATKLGDQQKFPEAIKLLDKAIEKKPDYTWALIDRGVYKIQLGESEKAISDFETILQFDPKNTLALYNLGLCKSNLNEHRSAINYFNMALDTKGGQYVTIDRIDNPNFPDPKAEFDVSTVEITFDRGFSFYIIDSLRPAINDYQFCVQKNYMPADSYYYLAYSYFKAGKNKKGCEALNKSAFYGNKNVNVDHLRKCEAENLIK